MTVTIGRASLNDLYDLSVRGRRVSFTVDIEGSDIYGMQALRQQLAGLVDNRDEEVVPFTWSEDSSLDGFYRVVSVDVPSADLMLSNGFVPEVAVELEQIPGFATTAFEVTTMSVVRTNGHGITAPVGVVATELFNTNGYETDLRPVLSSASGSSRFTSDGSAIIVPFTWTAPLALTSMRFTSPPASFYVGACRLEVKINGTWYTMVGRQIPAGCLWRISNGIVRLTPATSWSADGTFEMWDELGSASWESRAVSHWSNGALGTKIGFPHSTFPTPVVLRNSPEEVVVKVASSAGRNQDFTYRIQRGARIVSFSFTAAVAQKIGIGYAAADFAGSTSFTGGIARTASDSAGNRLAFGMAAASSYDTGSGAAWMTTAATSGSGWIGADLGGAGVTTALRDEFLGACSWRQRVIVK
jgi:hypothetical protein